MAGPCTTVSTTGTQLELVDFGIAYSEDFKFNSQDDRLELYNGVCIQRETVNIWQLEADSIVIENASLEFELRATSVIFQFDGWMLNAENLVSGKELFLFENLTLEKQGMSITASQLNLDLSADGFTLKDVNALYRNDLQISGKSMDVMGSKVVFNDAFVTTCMCSEQRLYDVRSPAIVFDESTKTLTLSDANLAIGDSLLPLGSDYIIQQNINLRFPTPFLDYSSDLELALRNIVLATGVALDIGAQGVDREHKFNPYGLLRLNVNDEILPGLGGTLKGVVGKATSGLQADVTYTRPLARALTLDVGTRNHAWEAANYLHDAFVGLSYRSTHTLEAGALDVVSRVSAAVTSQEFAEERLVAPRLGISVPSTYTYGSAQQGAFRLSVSPELTYYPTENKYQYALTVSPSFSISSQGFSFNSSYNQKITNSASPFTASADRLSEARNLNVSMGFQDTTVHGNTFGVSISTLIDFLKNPDDNQSLVRAVRLNAGSQINLNEESNLVLQPYLNAELARLITGIEDLSLDDSYSEDFIQFGLDGFLEEWELGLRARLNPTVKDNERFIEVLELGLGLPLRQNGWLFKPYLGVNFANAVSEESSLSISTYGLSAEYSCCGDAGAFFQVRDGNLTTGLTLPF